MRRDSKITQTTVRLFRDDIAELRKRAIEKRFPWQVFLRHLIHDALYPKKAEVK